MLIINSFEYILWKKYNSDELWRCRYTSLCKASIKINNSHDNILSLPNNHSHLPNIPKLKKIRE